MPSDRRLHPLSILFNIGRQFGAIALPLVLIVVGRGTKTAGISMRSSS